VFFIGDTHFDHKNIIRYTHRPFSNAHEMNEVIKHNWNENTKDSDQVYFLGDYTGPPSKWLGKYRVQLEFWIKQLKGKKISIIGNHDRDGVYLDFEKSTILHTNQYNFLLVHNPVDSIAGWQGRIIHGHVHNNNMDRYPFINGEQKTINVSAELTDFKPVSLDISV
jgi:calcineurin-like phosphoesterase family protein